MLWVLGFHIIFIVTWFAGLFYLPRLFVYHAMCPPEDESGRKRFHIMEHKLLFYITLPSGILASAFGFWLLYANLPKFEHAMWMHIKLLLVAVLWLFNLACIKFYYDFANNRNQKKHVFFRYFNEIPSVLLIVIVLLAVLNSQ